MKQVRDKLRKTDECVSVYFYDNGYMVDVSGRDHNDDYASSKMICGSMEEVIAILDEVNNMEHS